MQTFIVAAFTGTPFRGNPAGVCLLDDNVCLSASALQDIARELNQPETAFLQRTGDQNWRIRWFSPTTEVALCGHATLATAHVLWRELRVKADTIDFESASGRLSAHSADALIWLDFPAIIGVADEKPPPAVVHCVNIAPLRSTRHNDRWVFEYESAAQVRALKPRFGALAATGIRALVATAPSDSKEFDIVSRNFAPLVGVDEDQATGAAHCCLAPLWEARLGRDLRCYQASARGGVLLTRYRGDRVHLGGRAVIELAGNWRI
jgi:predicted PhzF superfamily epimerase YddE/YHI9